MVILSLNKKSMERMIYPAEGPYTEYEEEKYQDLLDYFEKKGTSFPENITKRRALRFIWANRYNIKNSYKNILKHMDWREEMFPIILDDDMKKIINSGQYYIHGRDRHFRPILFTYFRKFIELDWDISKAFQVSWFINSYLVNNLLTHGKVENWIEVFNLGGLPISKIPITPIKNFFIEAQQHVKWRIARFYIFNVTWGIRAIYTMIGPFIEK